MVQYACIAVILGVTLSLNHAVDLGVGQRASQPEPLSAGVPARALRLLETMEGSEASEFEVIRSVATKLGISEESVRRWRRKAQVDAGQLPGTSSSEHSEIRRFKRELAEMRRANDILKSASAFFADELDRPTTK